MAPKKNNKGKNCFITIDFEDWYTLPYLDKYCFQKTDCDSFCAGSFWDVFLEKLTNNNVHATFFVVATMIESADETIKKISNHDFLIGCHSYNHENLKNMSLEEFVFSTKTAKKKLEDFTSKPVLCYRAPSFSSSNEMVLALSDIGFKLDSSYIKSEANEYYTVKDFTNWSENSDGFLINDGTSLLEVEIPTVRFLGKRLPIGGGGFFRLYPFWFYKMLVKKYLKTHKNFVFFIHPYELNYHEFKGLKRLTFKERIKFNFNRKHAEKKFWKLIRFFEKEEMVFSDFSSFLSN